MYLAGIVGTATHLGKDGLEKIYADEIAKNKDCMTGKNENGSCIKCSGKFDLNFRDPGALGFIQDLPQAVR